MGASKRPKAVLATNGFTAMENYGDSKSYAQCVLMPTQWDDSTSTKDPVVGWSSADFHAAMGGEATYQQAAGGAVGVALANAMKAASNDPTQLLEKLKVMDVDSFYGKLKWTSSGTIKKPMFTVQRSNESQDVIAPTGAEMLFPLSDGKCWGAAPTPAPDGKTDDGKTDGNDDTSTSEAYTLRSSVLVYLGATWIGATWILM